MGGSCSINKSIFSPIQDYLVSNRFTILRSPPARPIFDGDIMSRLREINVLDFPLIETPREVMYNFLPGSSCRDFRRRKYRFCIYTRTNLSLTLGIRRVYILFLRGLSGERRAGISRWEYLPCGKIVFAFFLSVESTFDFCRFPTKSTSSLSWYSPLI